MADMTTAEKLAKVYEGVERTEELNAELEQTLYGIDTGGKSFYDEFWDAYQSNGERRDYWAGFAGGGWSDVTFKPKYPLDNISNAGYLFYQSNVTTAPRISLSTQSATNLLIGAKKLKWIDGLVFLNEIVNAGNFADSATLLAHCPIESGVIGVSLNASPCPFDKETIISFVNALSETKEGLTLTLKKTAVNKAFETSEGANDGEFSAEWDALGGENREKKNWAISLV